MDARVINPFITAVREVFGTMVRIEVKTGKPYVKTEPGTTADVSGIIGLSGHASGCVVLSFPSAVACRAASAFAGTKLDESHPDFADAIGELANMVAGSAKKDIEGLNISVSLPSVVIGLGHVIPRSRATPRIVIPCECALGQFTVEVGMVVEQAAAARVPTHAAS